VLKLAKEKFGKKIKKHFKLQSHEAKTKILLSDSCGAL
jgi:hypothetical protein